jgi:hypothetical protein
MITGNRNSHSQTLNFNNKAFLPWGSSLGKSPQPHPFLHPFLPFENTSTLYWVT